MLSIYPEFRTKFIALTDGGDGPVAAVGRGRLTRFFYDSFVYLFRYLTFEQTLNYRPFVMRINGVVIVTGKKNMLAGDPESGVE